MDIKGSEEKLHQVDSLLTTLTRILKKHWIIILIILSCSGAYFIITSPDPVAPEDTEQYDETTVDEADAAQYDENATNETDADANAEDADTLLQ